MQKARRSEYYRRWYQANKEHAGVVDKEWKRKNPERVREIRRTCRQRHRRQIKEYERQRRARQNRKRYQYAWSGKRNTKLKPDVLSHYSNGKPTCACCGEEHLEFLTIDHIDGRKHVGHARAFGGTKLYSWLRKNGWPNGYRVLCQNCNSTLGFYHYCPHRAPSRLLALLQ